MEGLIYINLSEQPQHLDAFIEDATEYFKPYDLPRTKIAHRQIWPVQANWKLVWENFQECYHCGPSHPEYCSVMAHALGETTGSAKTRQAYADYSQEWSTRVAAQGKLAHSKTRTTPDKIYSCNRHPIKPGYLTQSRDGQPVAPLLGNLTDYDGGITASTIYPGHYCLAACDHALIMRFTPQHATLTEVEATWLVRDGAEAGKDYDVDELTWLWRVTTDQDKQIVDDNRSGINSRFYQPGPYSDSEQGVKHFINWYLRQVS
jgi:Rieske 2Fe-2S family protein